MPRLYRVDNGQTIGEITPEQLQFLIDQLEEESEDDQDYFIDREVLEYLTDNGCDPALMTMLETALGTADDLDVAWD
jgi:hypothetical protein